MSLCPTLFRYYSPQFIMYPKFANVIKDSINFIRSILLPSCVISPTMSFRFALRINEGSRDTYDIYLKANSGFLGDRGSSYGRVLTVVIIPSPPPTSLTFTPSESRTNLGYDVIIQGQYCSLGHAWSAAGNLIGKETQFDVSH